MHLKHLYLLFTTHISTHAMYIYFVAIADCIYVHHVVHNKIINRHHISLAIIDCTQVESSTASFRRTVQLIFW